MSYTAFGDLPQLVAKGHIFVARPPLYRVTERKSSRFVQTAEEMRKELFQRGLKGTRLMVLDRAEPPAAGGPPRRIEGPELEDLLALTAKHDS